MRSNTKNAKGGGTIRKRSDGRWEARFTTGIDPKTGKFKLSRRVLLDKPEGYVERERRPRPERSDRGERRPRPERGERRGNHDNFEGNHEPKDFNDSLDHMDF